MNLQYIFFHFEKNPMLPDELTAILQLLRQLLVVRDWPLLNVFLSLRDIQTNICL